MKVIAAINGLVTSDISALYALKYAGLYGFTLVQLHVENDLDNREEVESSMAVIEELAEKDEVPCERLFLTGKAVKAVKNYLREAKIDILFCGTRTHKQFFENSFSQQITRASLPVDVAVVRVAHVDSTPLTTEIVMPIMEDRLSVRKFAFFSSMAKAYEAAAEIYSVTVVSRRQQAEVDITVTRDLLQRINTRLSHYTKICRLQGIPFRIKHAIARNEVDQVLHHVANHDFQLMIIGGRRFSNFSRLLGDPPLERIFRYTPINTIAYYERDVD